MCHPAVVGDRILRESPCALLKAFLTDTRFSDLCQYCYHTIFFIPFHLHTP